MGAAGRDFHNFNIALRRDKTREVVAFTAAQIPNITERKYPPELAGPLYPAGIPIFAESEIKSLIRDLKVDEVIFSYSDVSHEHVMHAASTVLAEGADFRLLGPRATMLKAKKPVVSICAVRTGAGKSPATRRITALLRSAGRRAAVIRHPMPYGDLARQTAQRFASIEDLSRSDCSIEEMEEYEPLIGQGHIVYAGVDYEKILRLAELDADILLWDGGNNDTPFFEPDLEIVVLDPHRPGHERTYFPGEVNFLRADVFIINKTDTAPVGAIAAVRRNIQKFNPWATVVVAAMPPSVADPELIRNKRVLVVEDGPTLTHGGMSYGAGTLAAKKFGAAELIDPRPFAVGSIRRVFEEYPHLGPVLPAVGYGREQIAELEATIRGVPCDTVVVASPVDLARIVAIERPTCRVTYEIEEIGKPALAEILGDFLKELSPGETGGYE
jgi:predicted GTPase